MSVNCTQAYYVYRAVCSKNNKYYIGITNNLKRRIKEHKGSKYPFGRAIRKHGIENFIIYTIEIDSQEEAQEWEELLIQEEQVKSDNCYNCSLGGRVSNVLLKDNPMHRPEVLSKHPNLFSTDNNPIKDPEIKRKMIESQNCKAVYVRGKTYYGVREAARDNDISRQCLVYRLKSETFPDHYYL